MSRAGQAGEAGSVFRCAVATHLAVHGLRSRPVVGLDLMAHVDPIRLDFETNDGTDDIRVTFTDGSCAYVAAKRKLATGAPLDDVAAGWAKQAASLGPEDLLVVATEEFSGPAKDLDEVLRLYRLGRELKSDRERRAFDMLVALVPDDVLELVLQRARVLHLPNSTKSAQHGGLLVALMDSGVEELKGAAAVAALSNLFHRRAGAALGSDVEDWVNAIEIAGVRVIADPDGPEGMRVAARLAAIDTYRQAMREGAGRIDLSLLAEDLPPITSVDLLSRLKIDVVGQSTPDKLLPYLRRWRRMLLVGQPGSGKSVALREIAAHCVAFPSAPVPIKVALPALVHQQPDRLTIDGMIEAASACVPSSQRKALVEYLARELAAGRAIVLLDGLDECGHRAAWVAQQLDTIARAAHPRTGFVLATRANAQRPADRLGLPRVELASPGDLDETVDRVLVACAEARIAPSAQEAWLETRRSWIRDARDQHDHLLTVPLLAILLALVCANASDADLPKGRARLLHQAVKDSVLRWEQTRPTQDTARPWSAELTSEMLLSGFMTLGRILDGGTTPTRKEAVDALQSMLRDSDGWALAPAAAREIGPQVLRFWDEHVAVFVLSDNDELKTRSKVFAEIATAMWASEANAPELQGWVADAIVYTDSDGAIALAAGLDPRTLDALLEVGELGNLDATLMAAGLSIREVAPLSPGQLRRTLEQLRNGVRVSRDGSAPTRRSPKDRPDWFPTLWDETRKPGAWPFVQAACQLAVPDGLRTLRSELIAEASLDERADAIATAISEFADAKTDGRALSPSGEAAVQSVVSMPLPAKGHMVRESRRRSAWVDGGVLVAGVAEVAVGTAERRSEIAADTDEWTFQIAMRSSGSASDRIFAALENAGFDTSRRYPKFMDGLRKLAVDHDKYQSILLRDLASIAPADGDPVGDEMWSLTDVGDLLAASGYKSVSIGGFAAAFTKDGPALRRAWFEAVADAKGIDKAAVARQALYIGGKGDTSEDDSTEDDWDVLSTEPRVEPRWVSNVFAALDEDQLRVLLSCIEAHSDWIAWSAANVLIRAGKGPWDSHVLLAADKSEWERTRAALIYEVAILIADDDREALLAQAVHSDSADRRYAARTAIAWLPSLDPDGSLMRELREDPDLAVRPKDARDQAPPGSCWTCGYCRAVNEVDIEDCPHCERGVRPSS